MSVPRKPQSLEEAQEWAEILEAWVQEQNAKDYVKPDQSEAVHALWDKLDDATRAAVELDDDVEKMVQEAGEEEDDDETEDDDDED